VLLLRAAWSRRPSAAVQVVRTRVGRSAMAKHNPNCPGEELDWPLSPLRGFEHGLEAGRVDGAFCIRNGT